MELLCDYLGRPYHVGDEVVVATRRSSSSSLYKCTVESIVEEEGTGYRSGRKYTNIYVKLDSNGRLHHLTNYHIGVIVGGLTFGIQPVQGE